MEELVMGGIEFLPCMIGSNQLYLYLEAYICERSALCISCFLWALLFEAILEALFSSWQSNKVCGLFGELFFLVKMWAKAEQGRDEALRSRYFLLFTYMGKYSLKLQLTVHYARLFIPYFCLLILSK